MVVARRGGDAWGFAMTAQTFESFAESFATLPHQTTIGAVAEVVEFGAPARVLGTVLSFAGLGADSGTAAERLLQRFGSIAAVLRATPIELRDDCDLPLNAIAVLGAILAVHRSALRDRLPERIRIDSHAALVEFLAAELRYRREEVALGLFLDADFGLIAVEVVAKGSVNHCPLTVRHVVERALAHGASAVVLAHNHPSGSIEPSAVDVETTRALQRTLQALDMDLVEHLIIGKGAYSILSEQAIAA